MRTHDIGVVEAALEQVRDDLKGLPPSDWLNDLRNVAMTNEAGDVALFEFRGKGIYCGHYFFLSRGREAVKAAKSFLSEFFSECGSIIIGFTPTDKKAAVWLTRHLGFSHISDEDIDGRPHRVSVMTRKDFDELSPRR